MFSRWASVVVRSWKMPKPF